MDNKNFICKGCLSVSRKMSPLTDTLDMYLVLLGKSDVKDKMDYSDILLCWECITFLRRMKKYQNRILVAQMVLKSKVTSDMVNLNPRPLSSLSVVHKSTYDLTIKETETEKKLSGPMSVGDLKEAKMEINNCEVNIKEEFDFTQNDMYETDNVEDTHNDVYETDNITPDVKDVTFKDEKDIENTVVVKQGKRHKRKARKIINHDIDLRQMDTYYVRVTTEEEIDIALERERSSKQYASKPHKCALCALSFLNLAAYNSHIRSKHNEKMKFSITQFLTYKCKLCGYACLARSGEQKKHLKTHTYSYVCTLCDIRLESKSDINKHYDKYHSLFICDYCGRRVKNKRSIIRHIGAMHGVYECRICNRTFGKNKNLRRHNKEFHSAPFDSKVKSEAAYCVECDIQFHSVYKYKRHLSAGVNHKPRKVCSVPCPKCGKTFSRRTYMKNHFKLFHIKQNNHYCDYCDKYFVTNYSLKVHKLYVHEKYSKPKDKICGVCKRGFHTNRILVNHMRTHTGERPFSCSQCAARFAQKTALTTHVRALHKTRDKTRHDSHDS